MRLRTFLATYALFLVIFFVSFGVVSGYMTSSQLAILKDKSASEFETIAASFAKDVAVLSGRNQERQAFDESVDSLVDSYSGYYRKNNITLALGELGEGTEPGSELATELSYIEQDQQHFIFVSGYLSGPFVRYRLEYTSDVTDNISELESVQRVLLLLSVGCSVFAAVALYAVLAGIFRPLGVIARASRKIADGEYSERIHVRGKNEISLLAEDFNRMAEEIERQIHLLEEEALQKQRFVDSFAHEIRTPLTSIYGYAEYMQNAPLDKAEVIESSQAILKEAGYMRKIAESLLELATLRQYTATKQPVNIPALFVDVSQSLRALPLARHAEIVCESEVDSLSCQEDLIRSLLMNLGFNALKADATVIAIAAKQEGGSVALSVTDNGCGIPAESIEKLTEPFYRVDKARSRETGGAGLGLALVRQIAEVHGARLRIESEPGEGTTVRVIFTTP